MTFCAGFFTISLLLLYQHCSLLLDSIGTYQSVNSRAQDKQSRMLATFNNCSEINDCFNCSMFSSFSNKCEWATNDTCTDSQVYK